MARARNIKPGFFINEDLVELPFSTRLLFIGLWTIADREGRLDDRPKKIKMALFPADNVDVERGLSELHGAGMIHRYIVENTPFIYIPGFVKHQNPHVNEQPSVIPAPDMHRAGTVLATPLTSSLNPDSPLPKNGGSPEAEKTEEPEPVPLSPSSIPKDFLSGRPRGLRGIPATPEAERLDEWLNAVAKTVGAKSSQTMASSKAWSETCIAAIREGYDLTKMLAAVRTERERTRDTPQFFTPNNVLKLLQNQAAKPARKKFIH